jgi:glutaredoxin
MGRQVSYVDVLHSPEGMQEMLHYSNENRRVPVIVDGGKVTTGFDGGS